GTGNRTRAFSIGLRSAPIWNNFIMQNCVSSGNDTSDDIRISASGGTTGGRITNMQIINCDTPQIIWGPTSFPAPWNTGWSVTIWKGDFDPTVTTQGIQTITVNDGFPP